MTCWRSECRTGCHYSDVCSERKDVRVMQAKEAWPGMILVGHHARGKVTGMHFHNSVPGQPVSIVFADGSHVTMEQGAEISERSTFTPALERATDCAYGDPFRMADALEEDGTVSYATVRRCEDCGQLDVVS